ncbi:putative Ser/Thr protein kinase [Paraburkholderia sp. GAS41]|jgi:predicted Ser/Thr protein kinase|uniref:serine/threonine protein kinase n=1 Tax=Paraburkholderia sp. GAS41 TaxID=3035134 RepID=UPI003D22F8AB
MANLAHAISEFQSGGLSQDDFIAQLDSTLTKDSVGSARLLEILGEAHTHMPLPPDVYAEVQRRIEQMSGTNLTPSGGETRVQTTPHYASADFPAAAPAGAQSLAGAEQVKGVGDTLNNRFVLEECLGIGGMGTVYKALDLRKMEASDRKPFVAIKVLNVQFRGNPQSLIALQREARKAQVLAHRNIVTVYDFDRDGAIVYLTMEYLSGKPLSHLLRNKNFKGMPYDEALPIVKGMANALAYAHEHGFVHCDFKPGNVLLTDKGDVKVIDFGIARVFQRPEEESDATVFDPGTLGALTPAYASPEMIEHREPDPRDDIYALGCIVYELLTGHHPFNRLSATQARSADLKPQRPEGLGTRQWRALRAALSFDRKTRMPAVARFVEEFTAQPRFTRQRMLIGGGAALAGLAVAGLGFLWFHAPGSPSSAPHAIATPPALTLASVDALLAQMPCSALAASVLDHTVKVHGFVPEPDGVATLKERLNTLPGVSTMNVDVTPLTADKCDVVQFFAPYWTRNWQAGHPAVLQVKAPDAQLVEDDPLVVGVKTPGYDAYVNIDYYQLDGSVVHMVPSSRVPDNQAPPNFSATVGSAMDWVIAKPFGTELVVLLITPAPLFNAFRPASEARADYLRALDARLQQIAAKDGTDRILADVVQITSRARKH